MWTADWADIDDATEFCSQFQDPTNFHKTEKRLSNFTVLGYNQKYSNDTLLELNERDIRSDHPKDVIHKYIINKSSL